MHPQHWWYKLPLRVRSLFRRRKVDDELREELQDHLQHQIEENMARGMSPNEARYAALRLFGGVSQIEEQVREKRGVAYIQHFLLDLRYGFQQLRRNPGFSIAAVATLAVGMGANVAIFGFIDAVILKPFPYPHPEQLVQVLIMRQSGAAQLTTPDFLDLERRNAVFSKIAGHVPVKAALTSVDVPATLSGQEVTADFLEVLNIHPVLGRDFITDDYLPQRSNVVILSSNVWRQHLGGDTGVIGRSVMLGGRSYKLIGVLPDLKQAGLLGDDFWVPLVFSPENMTRDLSWIFGIARLRPTITLDRARMELNHSFHPPDGPQFVLSEPPQIVLDPKLITVLRFLFLTTLAVLLVGCTNIVNLLMARGVQRKREISIRWIMGASRTRLIRQFFTEALLLVSLGSVAGLGAGWGLIAALKHWFPRESMPAGGLYATISWNVFALTTCITLLISLIFGCIAARPIMRGKANAYLQEGGSATVTSGVRTRLTQDLLVLAEIALSFLLSCTATLFLRSFIQAQSLGSGMGSAGLIMHLPLERGQRPQSIRLEGYLGQLLETIRTVPGVRDAAFAKILPGMPVESVNSFTVPGATAGQTLPNLAVVNTVSPSYFRVIGTGLVKGRALLETDVRETKPVAVINHLLAQRYFEGQPTIGEHILLDQALPGKRQLGPPLSLEVVGVVNDEPFAGGAGMTIYVSYKQHEDSDTYAAVQAQGGEETLIEPIQEKILKLNKDQIIEYVRTADQIRAQPTLLVRWMAIILSVFAGITVMLASVGIYGVLSCWVSQRNRELAVRMALGAAQWRQLRLILGEGLSLTAIGLTVGVLVLLAFGRILTDLGIHPNAPWIILSVGLLLAAIALIACYLPARRASRIDPNVVLRHE